MAKKYLIEGRLEDVLALLQVLALDEHSHRSEDGLRAELSAGPSSASSWQELAREHHEFFRVVDGRAHPVSLVTRHVAEGSNKVRPPLSPEHAQTLLNTAIELHDRQLRRSQRWTVLIPLYVAIVAGIFAVLT